MIHIILLILKIIGIILLVLAGLLLLAGGTVLFVPLRYRAEGEVYGNLKAKGRVTWLLHLISVTASYEEELKISVKICGFPLGRKRKEKKHEHKSSDPSQQEPIVQAMSLDASEEEKVLQDPKEDTFFYGEEPEQVKAAKAPEAGEKKSGRLLQKLKSIKRKLKGIKRKLKGIKRKIATLKKKKDQILAAVQNEENRELVKYIWKHVRRFIRRVLPKKVRGKLYIGFEDPYMTGQAMAVAGLLCPIYKNALQVYPDFENQILEGELFMKGRVRLSSAAALAFHLFRSRKFRKLLKKLLKD